MRKKLTSTLSPWSGRGGRVALASAPRADYARLHRVIKILSLIQGQTGWDVKRLAGECGVQPRTIYRDLNMLQGAGIPYFYDTKLRCYQVRRDYFMKPVDLTLDEALALVALGEHVGGAEQIPFTRAANRAVAKIRSQLPDTLRRELEGMDGRLSIKLAAATTADGTGDVYGRVRQAIATRRALRCRYDSVGAPSDNDPFIFKPYVLFFSQRAWYVIGHHGGRNALRCLKLNRFSEVALTDQAYTVPLSFSLKKHLGNAWRMIRGPRSYKVELVFSPEFAETIADTHWHDTQEHVWHDDGSLTYRCTVDGLDEIVWWVLSMGPHCKVNAPKELALCVGDLARRVVALYPGA